VKFQLALIFLCKALFVGATCALCGQFAFVWSDWQATDGKLSYLPAALIFLLLAWTMRLRFQGKEEKSWQTLAIGSSSIPILTLSIEGCRESWNPQGFPWIIFVATISGALLSLGVWALRKSSWGGMLGAVIVQSIINSLILLTLSMPDY
jgi:hypothetical protein